MGCSSVAAYDLPLYRPPSEAQSLIIQATIGCSFNRCTFCSMYRTKTFQPRPLADVLAGIAVAARLRPATSRMFLADGDAHVRRADDAAVDRGGSCVVRRQAAARSVMGCRSGRALPSPTSQAGSHGGSRRPPY